ncbi:MAG: ATP-binding protein [Verrucomicrobiales bacterium]|nr:ATP-binding protein [Verrucomicrobiales bacterium]
MSHDASWESENSRELAAALAWMRTRLQGLAQEDSGVTGSETPATPAVPPAQCPVWPRALLELGERLELTEFDREIVLLCAAMEFDVRLPELCARAQRDSLRPYPTFALAMMLFERPTWDALAPNGRLRYWRLIEIDRQGTTPLTSSPLRLDERAVHFLKGLNELDERLLAVSLPLAMGGQLADSQREVAESVVRAWRLHPTEDDLPVTQLLGVDDASKQWVAAQSAAAVGRALLRVKSDALPGGTTELEAFRRLWDRECRLLPLALYLEVGDSEAANPERLGAVHRFLARADGLILVAARDALPPLDRPFLTFDVERPRLGEQHRAWLDVLGPGTREGASALSGQFILNLPQIQSLGARARASTEANPDSVGAAAWKLCVQTERGRLGALAPVVEAKATWADLVLPNETLQLLRQIAAHVRRRARVYGEWGFDRAMNRGLGIAALFAGESGTGKTMAAEVLANDLGLSLHRIDLSAVVNKYIGETEKNLRRLFDAAEGSGSILFFDEADALFGKRSEVKDSHDRYANIEINYLLQRIEAYRGLAILATNMRSALDSAFLRRLRFVVNFPFPDAPHRRELWRRAFPKPDAATGRAGVPLADLDYDRLSRFHLAGGHIHSIALNAAFMAADAGTEVNLPLVLEAVRCEFVKLERPVNPAEFKTGSINGASHHAPSEVPPRA